MNVVTLTGNLATDVDLRDLGEDRQVASFLLAVDRPGRDETDFFRVATWNKQAELCSRFLSKGQRAGVEGRLRSSTWEEEGKRRTAVEVVATRVEFLSPPADANGMPFEAEGES